MTPSEYQQLVEFLAPRFDELRDRLGSVENRLDGVENRLDGIENRLEGIENRLDGIENRLTRVEVKVEENTYRIQVVAEGVTAVSQRLDRFQAQVQEEFKTLREEMAAGFSWVRDRFELQDAAIRDLGARMDRWEAN